MNEFSTGYQPDDGTRVLDSKTQAAPNPITTKTEDNPPSIVSDPQTVARMEHFQGGEDVAEFATDMVGRLATGELTRDQYNAYKKAAIDTATFHAATAQAFLAAERTIPAVMETLYSPLGEFKNVILPDFVMSATQLMKEWQPGNGPTLEELTDGWQPGTPPDYATQSKQLQALIVDTKNRTNFDSLPDDQKAYIRAELTRAIKAVGIDFTQVSPQPENAQVAAVSSDQTGQVESMSPEPNLSVESGQDITGDIIAQRPNEPEFIQLISDHLSGPESQFVFRMMSKDEYNRIKSNGMVGGEQRAGQLDSGVTWWGDSLADSLNQRGGAVYTDGNGASWGGDRGVLIAIPRTEVESTAIERRLRDPEKGTDAGYDAYKTDKPIPFSKVTDAFMIEPGRGDDLGTYRASKLI